MSLTGFAEANMPASIEDWNLTAIASECGVFKTTFSGTLFDSKGKATNSVEAFATTQIKRKFDAASDKKAMISAAYNSPLCEGFLIKALGELDPKLAKDRCRQVRDSLYVDRAQKSAAPGATPNFSMSAFAISSPVPTQDQVTGECDDLESQPVSQQFACSLERFRGLNKRFQKNLDRVLDLCGPKGLGVDMFDVSKKALKSESKAKSKH
jgi:hypothetical protein